MRKKLLWIVCITAGCWLACAGSAFADLEKLTDAELIAEYEAAGLAVNGPFEYPPTDGVIRPSFSIPNPRLQTAQREIFKRGSQIVPALIAFLEQEVPKEREVNPKFNRPVSFVSDVLQLLETINDPRAAPIALRILEGWDGKANEQRQYAALDALEKLTYCCFHKVKPHHGSERDSLEHPQAMNVESFVDEYTTPAKLYREWMQGEGKDPSQWLAIARKRARQLLAGEDFDQVYCAATFLRPDCAGRDDNPDATLARLAEIVAKMKKGDEPDAYTLDGKPVPVSYANWTAMITDYGPRARPYAAVLLRIQKEQGMNDWGGYAQLGEIGGPEILSYFFEVLPKISAEADKIAKEDGERAAYRGGDPRLAWLDSQREVRFGIDRWAGRLFDSDAEREAWWKENKTKPPEDWLFANLDILNKQVADNKLWAWGIAQEVLPDMPGDPDRRQEVGKDKIEEAFREEWLGEHRDKLRYDANAGCFRLAH